MERRETHGHDPRHACRCCHLQARGTPPRGRGGDPVAGAVRAQKRSALASRRSIAALVRRLSPPDSAPGQASWDLARAHDPMTANRGEDLALFRGRYPRPPVPVQGSTSRAGRSTGEHDARSRPGASDKPARRRRTRPYAQVCLPGTSLRARCDRPVTPTTNAVNRFVVRATDNYTLYAVHVVARFILKFVDERRGGVRNTPTCTRESS
jgi:hypothetical protein